MSGRSEQARIYRISENRAWRGKTELSPAQIHALAQTLAAITRTREEDALRKAYPVGARVRFGDNLHTVTGYTDSPGLPPMLKLSGNTIAHPTHVTHT